MPQTLPLKRPDGRPAVWPRTIQLRGILPNLGVSIVVGGLVHRGCVPGGKLLVRRRFESLRVHAEPICPVLPDSSIQV